MTTEPPDPLFDVVIYERSTGIIDSIAGANMRRSGRPGSFSQSAEKRLETVMPRLNGRYGAKIVPAGSVKKGESAL